MKIKFWQILCFILIIILGTIIIFPDKKKLVSIYIEEGKLDQARSTIDNLLNQYPNDVELLIILADLFLLEGKPVNAIETLNHCVRLDSQNIIVLTKLAKLYEWNRNSKQAIVIMEKIMGIAPAKKNILSKLIEFYRYYGDLEKEANAIARLVLLEKSFFPLTTPSNVFLNLMTLEMLELAQKQEQKKDSPYDDFLLGKLYLLRKLHQEKIKEEKKGDNPDPAEFVKRFLELFIITGKVQKTMAIATQIDNKEGTGIKTRLELVKIMRWFGLHKDALILLSSLNKIYPDKDNILFKMVKIAKEIGDHDTSIYAYKKLILTKPKHNEYKESLADLYLSYEAPLKAYRIYKKLAESTDKNTAYIDKMLTCAVYTGNSEILLEGANIAKKSMHVFDSVMCKKIAEVYLAADNPKKAYHLFYHLAENRKANRDDIIKMLKIAGYTSNKKVIDEAIGCAFLFLPKDYNVMAMAAKMYLWIEKPEESYQLYKKMVLGSKTDKKTVMAMIASAESSSRFHLIKDALKLGKKLYPNIVEIHLKYAKFSLEQGDEKTAILAYKDYLKFVPDDKSAKIQLGKIYLWTNQPKQAYKVYENLYKIYPDDSEIQKQLINIASWMDQPEKMTTLLKRLSVNDPDNFDKALAASNMLVDMGKMKEGIVFIKKALEIKPGQISARRKLSTYYGWTGLNKKMVIEMERLSSQGALYEEDYIILAQAYLDLKKGEKALNLLKKYELHKTLPQKEGIMLAMAYELLKQDSRAKKIYQRLLEENIDDHPFLTKVGNHALGFNHMKISLNCFETILKQDPNNLSALKKSGKIYAWNNKPTQAIRRLAIYNKLNPIDYESRTQLAELYFNIGREKDALKEYQEAMKLMEKFRDKD